MLCRRNSSGSSNRAGGRLHALTLSARWPAPLVEPGAVFAHPLALAGRRVALAVRASTALGRPAPPQLAAFFGFFCNLGFARPADQIAQVSCPPEAALPRKQNLPLRSSDAS